MSAPDPFAGVFAGSTCRLCGCTDENACPPTCWWVEDDLCSTCSEKIEALGSNLLASHDDYQVNEHSWTVCICGHIADGDDDDGSHARHVAEVVLASDWLAGIIATAKAAALLEAARYFEYEMAPAWGGDATWISTGAHVADLVAEHLRERVVAVESEMKR